MFQQPGKKLPPANYQHLVNQLLWTHACSHNTTTQMVQDLSDTFLSQGWEIIPPFPHSNLNQTLQKDKVEGFAFNSQ